MADKTIRLNVDAITDLTVDDLITFDRVVGILPEIEGNPSLLFGGGLIERLVNLAARFVCHEVGGKLEPMPFDRAIAEIKALSLEELIEVIVGISSGIQEAAEEEVRPTKGGE